jgi:hypothetical protein
MKDKLNEAATEAQRFLRRVVEYKDSITKKGTKWGTSESGALRRASLDLTRALAELRKP